MSRILAVLSRPEVRGWIYNVTIAALAIATGYGLLTGEQAALWLGLAAAVVGLARANLTPADGEVEEYDPKHDVEA